jgi:hypothetical protein
MVPTAFSPAMMAEMPPAARPMRSKVKTAKPVAKPSSVKKDLLAEMEPQAMPVAKASPVAPLKPEQPDNLASQAEMPSPQVEMPPTEPMLSTVETVAMVPPVMQVASPPADATARWEPLASLAEQAIAVSMAPAVRMAQTVRSAERVWSRAQVRR